MNEVSKEVFAVETHEKAKSYYNVSEQYAYKFLMEVKKIRDEKLFLELGCENFAEYTENYFGYSRNTINDRIKTADSWGEDYNRALGLYGKHKARQLGLLPENERENLIEHGVPTETGVKTIDEATTREIETYKRQLKSKDEQIATQAKMIDDLTEQEPEVIEKKVVVEKVPDDYEQVKVLNEQLSKQLVSVRNDLKMKKMQYELLEQNTASAKALEANIDALRKKEKSIDQRVKATIEFNDLMREIETFFDTKMASLRFKPLINDLYDTEASSKLSEVVNSVDFWVSEMRKIIPNEKTKIIEGEIIDG
ncbi:hypothetical protein [Enterococcus asini]|uniref:hypothetical protein n=1 Tax=Enterococcus asini TaxID=57732 RepID=UPI001E3BDF38|nr:hypothetical protein [Enterococcus asini]MCD5028714.1 hypothetical protein [Enterococcus asini]